MKRLTAILLTLVTIFTLVGCTPTLAEENGRLVDRRSGSAYTSAPICFEPVRIENEPFAKTKKGTELFKIEGLDTSLWLSEAYEGIGGVWYNDSALTLPSLSEFEAKSVLVCVEQLITSAIGEISEADVINALVKAFEEGESVSAVNSGTSYKLKFTSEKFPGLYYNLLYIEADDGDNYVYDRATKKCVSVGDILDKYMPR